MLCCSLAQTRSSKTNLCARRPPTPAGARRPSLYQPDMDDLTPYERERAAIIEANRARLAEMGLARAASALGVGAVEPSKPAPKPKRPPPARKETSRPTRSSKRLRGDAAEVKREPTSPEQSPSPPSPPPQKWTDAELSGALRLKVAPV